MLPKVFVLVALVAECRAHSLSNKYAQDHVAFMQQGPDSTMPIVHHMKLKRDPVVHHFKQKHPKSESDVVDKHIKPTAQSAPSQPDPLTAGTWFKVRGSLWLVSRVFIVLAIISVGVAIGFWRFGKKETLSEIIASMPAVSSPAHLQVGAWVKVVGVVAPVEEEAPLKSVLEGRPCVFSEASAVVPETGVTVARYEATCDLQIISDKGSDDVGPVLVHAADAAVLVPKPVLDAVYVRKLMPPDFEDFVKVCPTPGHCGDESLAIHALKFQEKILEVSARVAIVGVVSMSSAGKVCLVPDTVAHLQKTEGCRRAFRRHVQSLLSCKDAQFMSSHVVVCDESKDESPIPSKD